MAQATDILLDENGDIVIENNNLVMGFSDGQHIQDILELEPGELKENPLVGVNMIKKMNGAQADGNLRREIAIQLMADGYTLTSPVYVQGENVNIEAERSS